MVNDLWSVERNRQEDLQYNSIYSAEEKNILRVCHILPPLLQGITNLFDYSTNRNFIVLSFLLAMGGRRGARTWRRRGSSAWTACTNTSLSGGGMASVFLHRRCLQVMVRVVRYRIGEKASPRGGQGTKTNHRRVGNPHVCLLLQDGT